eukprot:scaffold45013_cov18-Tisochrysis_lutea.AAC.1
MEALRFASHWLRNEGLSKKHACRTEQPGRFIYRTEQPGAQIKYRSKWSKDALARRRSRTFFQSFWSKRYT